MEQCTSSLTIIFSPPYFKGVFEVKEKDKSFITEINLGTSEPKDILVYQLILKNWYNLSFYENHHFHERGKKKINPKRLQRQVKKDFNKSISTASQKALKEQHEAYKQDKNRKRKELRAEKKLAHFEAKQLKRKEKHRGH